MKRFLYLSFLTVFPVIARGQAPHGGHDDAPNPDVLASDILKDYERLSTVEDSVKKPAAPPKPRHIGPYRTHGFCIQIYSGNDRQEAMNTRNKFWSMYPSLPASVIFASPTYRVRVGAYRSNAEARAAQSKLLKLFGRAMVVPATVTIRPGNK